MNNSTALLEAALKARGYQRGDHDGRYTEWKHPHPMGSSEVLAGRPADDCPLIANDHLIVTGPTGGLYFVYPGVSLCRHPFTRRERRKLCDEGAILYAPSGALRQ